MPPNFITIIGVSIPLEVADVDTRARSEDARAEFSGCMRYWSRSHQIALGLEQLGIQHRRPGRAANGIVRKHGKLPIQHAAGPQTPDRVVMPFAGFHIKPRLRPVVASR